MKCLPKFFTGNMWAQTWEAIYPIVMPHPDQPGFDVTEELQKVKKRFYSLT
jgi:hypothetical protein